MSQLSADSLGTVQRVAQIVRFFAERGETSLKELSATLGLAPSTCHRLLELLGRDGLVEQDAAHGRYRVGREFFRIAALVQSRHDLRSVALPFLRQLADSCGETCVLGLYLAADGKMFFAEKCDSRMMLRYQLPMNVPMSLVWGASGRAILAFLDAAEIARIHAAKGNAPVSGEKLPARRTLDKDLAAIRARGYGVTQGQKIAGAVGIAAPVFGAGGRVLGSICATVPETRIAPKNYPRLGERVRATAGQVSAALGAPSETRAKLEVQR